MKIRFILMNMVIVSSFTLTGCSTTDVNATLGDGNNVKTANQHFNAVNPEQVKIYYKSELPKHYTVVGRVAVQNYNIVGMTTSQESIMKELKKQAASMGANGIIHISTGLAQTTAEAIRLK